MSSTARPFGAAQLTACDVESVRDGQAGRGESACSILLTDPSPGRRIARGGSLRFCPVGAKSRHRAERAA